MNYEQALAEADKIGLSRCSDAAAMAAFCRTDLPLIMGAVGPRLVWEGARRRGLSYKELATLCISEPDTVEALQWLDDRATTCTCVHGFHEMAPERGCFHPGCDCQGYFPLEQQP